MYSSSYEHHERVIKDAKRLRRAKVKRRHSNMFTQHRSLHAHQSLPVRPFLLKSKSHTCTHVYSYTH